MKKKMLFIYNPYSGKSKIKNKLSDVLDLFVKYEYEVLVHPTQDHGDAVKIVKEYAPVVDRIVCSGGDGTLNEVVDGLMLSERRPVLGYIPSGTVNDFATSLQLPKNVLKAARLAMDGEIFSCDMGSFNEEFFSYVAAFGLFTDVAYTTSQQTKNLLGGIAYFLEGVKRLTSIHSYHMKIYHDGEMLEDEYIFGLVTNSTSVGGFKGFRGKGVKLDDGLFEVSLIKTPKNPIELQMIVTALLKKEINKDFITTFRTSQIEFLCDREVPWTLDGEFGGSLSDAFIENRSQAVQIMIDPKKVTERVEQTNDRGTLEE